MELTERQQSILTYVHDYLAQHGKSPTMREIAMATGTRSTSIVAYNLRHLERRGLLQMPTDRTVRGLRLPGQRLVWPGSQVRVRVGDQVFAGELVG